MKRFTPDKIESLAPNEIFVFGSNLAGIHGAGAAKLANKKFKAQWDVGEGLTGQCYAFPTKNIFIQSLSLNEITLSAENLFNCCRRNPNLIFLLTKVGCGLAGYTAEQICSVLANYDWPDNLIMPKEFHDIIYEKIQT